jgi:tetratricopeptide (TPR) repeat protein
MTGPNTRIDTLRQLKRAPENTWIVCCVAVVLACWGLGFTARVAAQPSEDPTRDASARALFQEGLSLAERSDWQGAEDRFRRALTLRASPVIAYNLASVLMERGKLVEASELLRKVDHDDKVDAAMRQSIRTMQAELEGRIGRIAVIVRDKQPTDRVLLDGNELLEVQLGVDVPIDPGVHRLSLEREGRALDAQSLEVAPGGSEQVTLIAPLAPTPRQVASALLPAPEPAAPSSRIDSHNDRMDTAQPITGRWWFWTGVGVVTVGAIVLVALAASSGGADKRQPAFQGDFAPASLKVQVVAP